MVLTAVPAFACPSLTITASPTTVTAGNDTTLTIAATSNGNYTGAYIEVASTGGPGTLTSFTTLGSAGCGGGVTSCASDGSYYKLDLPALTNGEKFSYTVDLNIGSSTAATTFTPTGEFFESNGTNIGAQSGPVITVNAATVDLYIDTFNGATGNNGTGYQDNYQIENEGPGTLTAMTFTVTTSPSGALTTSSISYNGPWSCVRGTPTTTCTLTGPLASGDDVNVTLNYTSTLLFTGTGTDTGTITSNTPANTNSTTSVTGGSCGFILGLEQC
jgi:hypothetical protein